MYNPGGALSIRPGTTPINFHVSSSPTAINAQLDVFQGVVGWVTVSNAPSSPTASAAASITVGGQNVDFYIYQLNANAWSAEFPISSPLTLSGSAAAPTPFPSWAVPNMAPIWIPAAR